MVAIVSTSARPNDWRRGDEAVEHDWKKAEAHPRRGDVARKGRWPGKCHLGPDVAGGGSAFMRLRRVPSTPAMGALR